MKIQIRPVLATLVLLSTLSLQPATVFAQGTVFTYQGRVMDNGTNFTGAGQFEFALVTSTNANHTVTGTANAPSGGYITGYAIISGGNGYVTAPAVTVTGGGGAGAAATAHLTGNVVTSISVANPGNGLYTSTPTMTIAPPPPNIAYSTYWSNDGTSVSGSEPAVAVGVPVSSGLFTVALGDTTIPNMAAISAALFAQPNLQLRIWFNDGVTGFAALSPVQNLTPTPYAIQSLNATTATTATTASSASSVAAANIVGTLALSQLQGAVVTNNQSGVNLTGTFTGDGGGVTNVSANSLVLITTNVSITSWGWNVYGQRTIPPNLGQVVAVAAGVAHSLALQADGTVAAWGAGQTNNPGDGVDFGQSIVPVGLSNVVVISAGYLHSLVVKSNGTVVAWGAGLTNNLSYGVNFGQSIVPAGLSNVLAVSAGAFHSLALKANRTVIAWGAGLTNNPTDSIDYGQSIVPAGLSNVVAISAGIYHSLALKTNGTVLDWGANQYGQTNIPAGLSNVVAVAAGGFHNLALKMDGTVVAWGAGTSNNPTDGINFGQSIVPAGLSNVVAIVAGYLHSVALESDGTVMAWGAGQTNDPSTFGEDGQALVPDGLNNVLALGPGCVALHTIVLRKQSEAPVAWLNSDNTFNGSLQVNGNVHISGELTAGGDLRLNDANLWLRDGSDQYNGLGWYGAGKTFAGQTPDGPVLFGASGGALGTSTTTNGQQIALSWNSSQQVGIGTATPSARLDLGSDAGNSKLLLYDGNNSMGLGANSSQFMFNLGGSGGRFSFMDAPGGHELVTITSYGLGFGYIGIGTATPNSRLDVRGSIALGSSGQYLAVGGKENLFIIRGHINSSGGITTGTGFTVTKTGTGAYTVTFTTPFSAEPTVTVSPQVGLARIATITNVGAGSVQVRTFDSASGSAIDQDFHFIAIGPQ